MLELGRLCPAPPTGLGRTGHHGEDSDGRRYIGGARIEEKENESLVLSARRERAQTLSPGWRVGFTSLLDSLM